MNRKLDIKTLSKWIGEMFPEVSDAEVLLRRWFEVYPEHFIVTEISKLYDRYLANPKLWKQSQISINYLINIIHSYDRKHIRMEESDVRGYRLLVSDRPGPRWWEKFKLREE